MSDYSNVADQVRAGVKRLEWITQLADALDRVGSIEQAEKERQAALKVIQSQVQTARDELALTKERVEEAKAALEEVDNIAKERGAKAQVSYEGTMVAAKAVIAGAQNRADEILADAAKAAKAVEQESDEKRKAAERELAMVQADVQAARDDLAGINAKIAEAKAQASQLFAKLR